MKLSEKLFIAVCVAFSAGTLALAFALADKCLWSPIFVALGALWIIGQRREQTWTAPLSLLSFIAGAVLGFWVGHPGWITAFCRSDGTRRSGPGRLCAPLAGCGK